MDDLCCCVVVVVAVAVVVVVDVVVVVGVASVSKPRHMFSCMHQFNDYLQQYTDYIQ